MAEENISFYINSLIKYYGETFGFVFIGVFIWLIIFSLFIYWKSLFITYCRKDEKFNRAQYYLYIEYKASFRNIAFFSCIAAIFLIVTLCLKQAKYIHFWGSIIFFSSYTIYCINHYYIRDHFFDLFDDFIWIYLKCISKKDKTKLKTL